MRIGLIDVDSHKRQLNAKKDRRNNMTAWDVRPMAEYMDLKDRHEKL